MTKKLAFIAAPLLLLLTGSMANAQSIKITGGRPGGGYYVRSYDQSGSQTGYGSLTRSSRSGNYSGSLNSTGGYSQQRQFKPSYINY